MYGLDSKSGVIAMVVIVWWLDLQLPMQSIPITTDVVSSNLDQSEVYNIVIQFISDLRQVGGFLRVPRFPLRYNWNIVESGIKHHQTN